MDEAKPGQAHRTTAALARTGLRCGEGRRRAPTRTEIDAARGSPAGRDGAVVVHRERPAGPEPARC
jgi:hypothetical protein